MNLFNSLSRVKWSMYAHWAIVVFAGLVFYFEPLLRHFSYWLTYEGSYRLLVLGLGLYMTWQKKRQLKLRQINPSIVAGSAVTAFGCFLAICGDRSSTLLLQDASLIITLLGLIWLLLGLSYLRAFWICVAYIAFIFPVFEESLKNLSSYLQITAAWIASFVLKTAGMTVFLSGQVLELPHITLDVIEECSGIHHITTLLALALPVSVLSQKGKLGKVLLVVSAAIFGVFANGLRIALIGFWTANVKSGRIHGPFELFYVSFILFCGAVFILLITILSKRIPVGLFVRHVAEKPEKYKIHSLNSRRRKPLEVAPQFIYQGGWRRSVGAIVSALFIFAVAASYLNFYEPYPSELKKALSSFPREIEGWSGYDVVSENSFFEALDAPEQLHRAYEDSLGNKVNLYMGYFSLQKQGKELVSDNFNWLHNQSEAVQLVIGSEIVEVRKVNARQGKSQKAVYFWYDINGKIITNQYQAKLVTLQNAIFWRKTNGAIIAVIANRQFVDEELSSGDPQLEFIQCSLPTVKAHLNNL